MTVTIVVLLALGAGALLWCLRLIVQELVWSRARNTADKELVNAIRAATAALAIRRDVAQTVLEKTRAGQNVSDADVAELVETTGAPVAVVFEVLDALAGRPSGSSPGT
jgi:hypothetical protein